MKSATKILVALSPSNCILQVTLAGTESLVNYQTASVQKEKN